MVFCLFCPAARVGFKGFAAEAAILVNANCILSANLLGANGITENSYRRQEAASWLARPTRKPHSSHRMAG